MFSFENGALASTVTKSGLLKNVDLVRVGPLSPVMMAPILPPSSPLVKPFNQVFTLLRERGVLSSLSRKHITELPRLGSMVSSGKVVLGLDAASGAFAAYGIALASAFVILILEIIRRKIRQ